MSSKKKTFRVIKSCGPKWVGPKKQLMNYYGLIMKSSKLFIRLQVYSLDWEGGWIKETEGLIHGEVEVLKSPNNPPPQHTKKYLALMHTGGLEVIKQANAILYNQG